MVRFFQHLFAIGVDKLDLVATEDAETALDLAVGGGHGGHEHRELLAHCVPQLRLPVVHVVKHRPRFIHQVAHKALFLSVIDIVVEAIASLTQQCVHADDHIGDGLALAAQLQLGERSEVGVQEQLVHAHANDQQLLVHQLVVQDGAQLFQAAGAHQHLDGVRAAHIQVRFEELIEFLYGNVKLNVFSRPIIYVIHLSLVYQVIVKVYLIGEEHLVVLPIHILALLLVHILKKH